MDDRRHPHLRPSRSRRRSRSRNGRGGATGELSVCFLIRRPSWSWGWASSSSMRTPSARSLPSPGRAPKDGGGGSSFTGSLSRRLRSSGSVKGGQSPAIFPSFVGGGRKKGAAAGYDGGAAAPAAAEPSSPKVTCIGQVRVKTSRRKQKKKAAAAAGAAAGGGGIDGAMALRSRSRREGGGGSFRRGDSGEHLAAASTRGHGGGNCRCGNCSCGDCSCSSCIPRRGGQSWVYLPLGAMCEALRALACCFTGWSCDRCWGCCSCKEKKGKGGEEKVAAGSKRMSWSWCCFKCSASSSCCSGCCTCDGGRRKKGSRRKGKQQQKKSTGQTGTVCSCTAAFARCWMMEMHVEKGGKGGGHGDKEEDVEDEVFTGAMVMERGRSRRGMADLELVANELQRGTWKTADSNGSAMVEGEIEIEAGEDVMTAAVEPPPPPPPNALLLMRCRSDPVKIAAMATRFVDFPATKVEIQEAEEEDDEKQVTAPHRNGMRKPAAQLHDSRGEIIQEERKTAAEEAPAAPCRVTVTAGAGGGRDQQRQGPSCSRPVFEIEEPSGKGGRGDSIVEKREAKLPPQHLATRPSVAASTEEPHHPPRKVSPLPEEVENRAASLFPTRKERPKPKQAVEENSTRKDEKRRDPIIPRDRDVRNNAPPLKERRSFSRDKDAVPPPVPGGGRRPSVSSSDRDDAAAGARRSSSYREGRRSSFSSDGGDARRSSFGADNKGDGKRRWSFSSEKDAKRAETTAADQPRGRVRRDQAGGADANGTKCGGALAQGTASAEEAKGAELPDCLLLMMYEPKLSMEVSKETWVCTADFVRWRPQQRQQRQQNQQQQGVNGVTTGAGEASKSSAAEHAAAAEEEAEDTMLEEETEDAASAFHPEDEAPITASAVHPSHSHQPSSQSPQLSPSAKWEEDAAAADQKLGSASAVAAAAKATASSCGPVTLTRCKSDPVRLASSPSGMSPEGCFWKSRYMPTSTATAGIGF